MIGLVDKNRSVQKMMHKKTASEKKRQLEEKKNRLKLFLKKSGFKSTRQRDIIAKEFLSSNVHITAEELYRKIISEHDDIGFTTVYRTLKLLTQSGLAAERVFADNLTRYEPLSLDQEHHDHLICLNCGSIMEFQNTRIEKLQDVVANEVGFATVQHKLELYGYCKNCRND